MPFTQVMENGRCFRRLTKKPSANQLLEEQKDPQVNTWVGVRTSIQECLHTRLNAAKVQIVQS